MAKNIKCIIVDDEPMAREILENHLNRIDSIEILGLCKNAVEAFNLLNSHAVDLIFLDINMPEISGLSFARSINKDIKVIFTTAYREYAVDGFDLKAVDYLLKPISFDRLIQSIEKYKNESLVFKEESSPDQSFEKSDFFFVRSNRKMIKIKFSDLQYIESLSDYVKLFVNGKAIITRETISSIEAKLPAKDFLRVHRSFIVSLNKIDSFTQEFVEIENKAIPISRSYKNDVKQRLDNV
ncbi:LytTR family DNA-binding domain-containing protein [Lutimonas saemankumensis]|uniref:LytR/AlgR family response regulator transcription factor n=1 Tax=Lutimonas saemankumensis TaxID=483016 RepID=UPI001CD2C829|nr:LytTR family DNA-binding domain-containing protein [Lutimonas saemankumensis]MCA0932750.1 LytTR family DNA-binding domain-containing protein [Lutimonas saemankumensis]